MREHTKATYRVVVLGLVALMGPPAFSVTPGLFAVLYSILLVLYALWTLRLTVVFREDCELGLMLSGLDAAIVVPMFIWGSPSWLTIPLVGFLLLGLLASLRARIMQKREERSAHAYVLDRATGLLAPRMFQSRIESALNGDSAERGRLGVVTIELTHYGELAAYYGLETAERSVAAVCRRARRVLGPEVEGFRVSPGLVALLVERADAPELAEAAIEVSHAANGRLIDGHKITCFVGYACAPRDGSTAAELLDQAEFHGLRSQGALSRLEAPVGCAQARAGAVAG